MRAVLVILTLSLGVATAANGFSGKKKQNIPKSSENTPVESSGSSEIFWFSALEEKFGEKLYACQESRDCVLVQGSVPCNCSGGGTSVAINANYERDWNESRNKIMESLGKNMMCPMVFSCAKSVLCQSDKCETSSSKDAAQSSEGDRELILRKQRKRR